MPGVVFPVGLLMGGDVFDQLGVDEEVSVVSEFADRDPQPITVADLGRVGVEGAQFPTGITVRANSRAHSRRKASYW